jgi:hypothetical protein
LDSSDVVVSTIRKRTCTTQIAHEHYKIPTQFIPYLGPHLLTKHLCTMLTCRHDLYPAVVLYTAYAEIGKDASILADCLKPPQLLAQHPTPDAHLCNLSLLRNGPKCGAKPRENTTATTGGLQPQPLAHWLPAPAVNSHSMSAALPRRCLPTLLHSLFFLCCSTQRIHDPIPSTVTQPPQSHRAYCTHTLNNVGCLLLVFILVC